MIIINFLLILRRNDRKVLSFGEDLGEVKQKVCFYMRNLAATIEVVHFRGFK
jgi:hypothetical protein